MSNRKLAPAQTKAHMRNNPLRGRSSEVRDESSFANTSAAARSPNKLSAIRPIPRRGLSRTEAAIYIGVSTGKLDETVRSGRMPGPKRIDGRKVWDVHELDVAFDALPTENGPTDKSWDDL